MTTSTKSKMQQILDEAQGVSVKRKTAVKEEAKVETKVDEKFADVDNNTFYKIVFSDADPETKKKAIAEALSYKPDEGKEKNQEILKEFTLFKEYLQEQRKLMAQEIIKMTDTGAFSELKATIDELNSGLIEYDKRLEPLMQILDAVYELRKEGGETVLGVFKEIKDDQEAEEARKRQIAENEVKLQGFDSTIANTRVDIEMLKKQRKWFGLGGIKEDAMRQILMKEEGLKRTQEEVAATAAELEGLRNPVVARETKYAKHAEHKKKIRELLDISSEEHKSRQKALVAAAQNFVVSTDQRVGSVLGHLDGMAGQINNLFDANNGMQTIYAVLTEGSKEAAIANQQMRSQYEAGKEGESVIEQLDRESKKVSLEDHIASLGNSTIETVKTLGDLSTQGARIKSMREANREQVSKTRELHSSGVAGVADRLSTVLQAVSAAALNESSEAAKLSINTMLDKTNAVAMQEALRTAMGLRDVADGMDRALADLESYREGTIMTTRIARENLAAIQEGMAKVHEKAREVQEAVKDSIASNADIDLAAGTITGEVPAPAPANDAEPVKKPAAAPKDAFAQLRKM